jgi:hypothetical protein
MKFFSLLSVFGFGSVVFGEQNVTETVAVTMNSDPKACNSCSANVCSILPPGTDSQFPCYEGTNEDTKFCYNTDPLIPNGAKWVCGQCADFGFPNYLQNDPIYKNMELWTK